MCTEDDEDTDFVESGPFCRHWGDPSDCDWKCANCGHTCAEHGGIDEKCHVEGCSCEEWKEPA